MSVCGEDAVCASEPVAVVRSASCAAGPSSGKVLRSGLPACLGAEVHDSPSPGLPELAEHASEWTAPPRGVEAPPAPHAPPLGVEAPSLLLAPPLGVEAPPLSITPSPSPLLEPPLGVQAPSLPLAPSVTIAPSITPPLSVEDPSSSLTPRMRAVYERTSVRPRGGIHSIMDAISMKSDALGRKTEAIRRMALRAAIACDRSARSSALSAVPIPRDRSDLTTCDNSDRPSTVVAATALAGSSSIARPHAVVPWSDHPSLSPAFALSAPRDVEGERITVEVQRLLNCVPDEMLMYGRPSSLPSSVRRANLVDAVSKYDAGTIAKGRAAVTAWVAFCVRHALPQYGAPFGADYCVWFLREEDASARARASSSLRRTGASVKHDRACSLRWLAAVGCVPFDARESSVRRSAPSDSSREPAMTPMWEVAVVRHFLVLAVRCDGARSAIIRAYAAAAYIMCLASLRQLDALRSAPPQFVVIDGVPSFAGVAAYTKGHNTRAHRRPMPWWVPAVSVDPFITDDDAARSLREIFDSMSGAPSLFCEVLNASGNSCSLSVAVSFGANRARPEHVMASIAYLLMWSPLSYPLPRAKAVAAGRHGPRHVLPELARVLGMPAAARDELGRWKDGGGRLQRHSNRYSREGERLMQIVLRRRLANHVRTVLAAASTAGSFVRLPLRSFAASSDGAILAEQSAFDDARERCLAMASQ